MQDASPEMLSLFCAALERPAPEERAAYLEAACGTDVALRARLEALLRAYEAAGGFLPEQSGAREPRVTTAEPVAERLGTVVGPYKLLQPIGEGGMGSVFMAEQQQPVRRKVALKVIKPGMDSQQVIARFEAERQALALMDHPNIARVLDAGATQSGHPYFVMELVKGVPITTYCDERRLTPRQRLELFVPVCQAVQHAHTKGVIHRDLKPSNVLVALYDGKPVPKVIDFGVAKATGVELTDKTLFTGYGAVIGTLEYMSPEQAQLNNLDIDTRSDVYALGVLLYELLTGTTPLDRQRLKATSLLEALRLVREEEAVPPSTRLSTAQELPTIAASRGVEQGKLSGLVRGEVDWIVLKALEKDRNRRYETANSLARDLERYLNDEPVLACPPSAAYRLKKYARRHRAAMALAAVVLGALVVAVIGLALSTTLIWQAKNEAVQALEREQLSSYWQRIALAEREFSANNLLRVQELLDLCPEKLRGWEWHYLKRLRGKALPPLRHDHPVRAVAASPDGRRIVSADFGGFVTIWDLATGVRLHRVPGHDKPCGCIEFSPNGGYFVTSDFDPAGQRKAVVKVWHGQTGKELAQWEIQRTEIDALAFSADGKLACSSCNQVGAGVIDIREPMTGDVLFVLGESREGSNYLAFTPDGKLLAEASLGGEVKLWDVRTRACVRTLRVARPLRCLALSRDGQLVAAGYGDEKEKGSGKVHIWEVQTGSERPALVGQAARSVAFSPDGSRLATGGIDQAVKIWDAGSGHEILTLRGHFDWVQGLVFTPDGQRLVSACDDKNIRVWDARPLREGEKVGEELFTLEGHSDCVNAVAFHPTQPLLATGSTDGSVKMWDTRSGRVERTLPVRLTRVDTVAFSPDGKRLAVAGQPATFVTLLDTTTGKAVAQVKGHGEWIIRVAFSPDGKSLATAGNDGDVVLHDVATGKEVGRLRGHRRVISDIAFPPDAGTPLLASTDGQAWTVRVWTTKPLAARPDATLSHQGYTSSVAFSPDGRLLATGGWDRMVRVWDRTWKQVDFWRDQTGAVQCLAFSPTDGRLLAWGATDSTVKVWQRQSGEVVTLRGHTDAILGLAFSHDGKRIASASNDGTARIWKTPTLP
jgi:WD40 repeat protein/serine/threonine protein kinase